MSARIVFRYLLSALVLSGSVQAAEPFQLHEATIERIHAGIRAGDVTCKQIVEAYAARAAAYNGSCTKLVTADGAKAPKVLGTVRGGAPLKFATDTVAIKKLFPDFDKYKGLTPDYGRMEPTLSNPAVQQQFGMVVGMPNARQVNGLETINLRGERSVTCKKECDAATGALPGHCPAACDAFRKYPDAVERAAELDKQYGRNPDTVNMPLYCVPMSFKAVYDAKDMRSTGGGDVNYAMDAAPMDSTLTARMRAAGAIIYAQAHNAEYNGGSGDPSGDAKVTRPTLGNGGSRETWGGVACNPYDTERVTGGSSAGSGVSVAANLVMCSICETTGGSCRSPGTHNGVVTLVPTKGMISYAGGIGAHPYQDRPGIQCRTMADATLVLDAFRDKSSGSYFDARDPYTALPRVVASKTSYVGALSKPGAKPLAGMRIGVIRELMVKQNPSDAAISDGINRELKVLKDLGAELVETVDPAYPDDPAIANMKFTFQDAIAEVIPFHMPEVLSWKTADGKLEFAVPGHDVTSREYMIAASSHKAPWPANLNLSRIFSNPPTGPDTVTGYTFAFQFGQYLLKRGDSRVYNWETLNANAKYFNDVRYTAMKNWEKKPMDIRTDAITFTMKRRDTMRMALMKVLEQNKLDVLVNPSTNTLPNKIGGANEPNNRQGFGYGASLGTPEVFVPAGFSDTVYDATFKLSADGTKYETVSGTAPTKLATPLPYNIAFWAGIGEEATLIKVASAYEAATHHRRAPPAFGPLKGEPGWELLNSKRTDKAAREEMASVK